MLSQKNLLINLIDIKTMDNYTYEHSVSLAILSVLFKKWSECVVVV